MAAEPRAAASLLVLRDSGEGIEVLFVRRHESMRFMGGAWVFPGGALSEEDGDAGDELAWKKAAVRETEEEAGIALEDAASLVPFSRWITPELVPMRFDTRFFLAAAPHGVEPEPDLTEVDAAEWWTPAKAIDLFVTEQAQLHFPTIKQVENLVEFASVDAALAAQAGRTIEPILPRVATSDDGFEILLPGDPGYEELS
jgi:8-oxo-dGTP pyrophosphatase MutT (NUDIX family)